MVTFSVQTQQRHLAWPELLDIATALDSRTAYQSLWLIDHFSSSREAPSAGDGPILEAWTTLAALATSTTRIRLGTLVSSLMHRSPALLAKMATTVDQVSGGRVNLGIGSGYHEAEHRAYGISFPPLGERLKRLEEALQVIRLLWTESMPIYEGVYYQLDRPSFSPPNVQRPHPPILVGGLGERVTLQMVARYADACNFRLLTSPDDVRRKFAILDDYCRGIGRDPATIRRTVEIPLIDETLLPIMKSHFDRFGVPFSRAPELVMSGPSDAKRRVLDAYIEAGVDEVVIYCPERVNKELLLGFNDELIGEYT